MGAPRPPSQEGLEAEGSSDESAGSDDQEESRVVDISGKSWQLSQFEGSSLDCTSEGLFVYKNTYHLIPASIGKLEKLKTIKFFANEVEVLPPEVGELTELESVQIRVSSPRLSEVSCRKMQSLKELELCKVPPRPSSTFSILSDISNLKCLTKLTVSHFSIRYFPPEIGSLKKLEELDLSFNKLKNLPNSIAELSSLRLLKITDNKLVDVPSEISHMKFLENLDLSNNRLTSVSPLNLRAMIALQYLNLQFNRISYSCQIPPWICCDMRGNNDETRKDEKYRSIVPIGSSYIEAPACLKIDSPKKPAKKVWKRHEGPQQRAREERLNLSRNLKHVEKDEKEQEEKEVNMTDEEEVEEVINIESSSKLEEIMKSSPKKDDIEEEKEEELSSKSSDLTTDDSSCVMLQDTASTSNNRKYYLDDEAAAGDSNSKSKFKFVSSSKRHPDGDGDGNPKPSKVRKPPVINQSFRNPNPNPSHKYNSESFCGVMDRLIDGFYDAGREQQFMPLHDYENYPYQDSREIIRLDREQDEELDSIVISAQLLLSSFNRLNLNEEDESQEVDNVILRASLLALFVSDCFGGSDRSASLSRTRRAVVSLNKEQPFVCTCNGNVNWSNGGLEAQCGQREGLFENPNFTEICNKSLRFIKERRNSNVVPLGALRFGVCRHRALLMKYLCDRMEPTIPCELVRGYLDFTPHAWNAVLVKRAGSWIRMVVDPCYPTNIREENDPEYFCRYIPMSRLQVQTEKENAAILGCSFPFGSRCREIESTPARTLYHCKFGNVDAAIKVRSLDTRVATNEDLRNFEYMFLGEVRMLGALRKHRCIVDLYGHQLSSKWVPLSDSSNNNKEYKLLQSVIIMEYVKGGSLKSYMKKLSEEGEKQVPIDLAAHIAREVACALVELHSKQIIHRDIKSDNIMMDLESNRGVDCMPLVKLVDFDQSIPLQSQSHTCCIAHLGVRPPCVCVGTPRWMAPEVFSAVHLGNQYGLEVDIWSYGCFLFELLTLRFPYHGLSDIEIYKHFEIRKGPRLTEELEDFYLSDQHVARLKLGIKSDSEADKLNLLIKLFYQCTQGEPSNRPSAQEIYDSLSAI